MLMQRRRAHRQNFPGYLWRDEVRALLDIDDPTLDTYVNNGSIRRIHPPGRKQWVYDKEDVDRIYREMRRHLVLSETVTPTFTRAQPDEMEEIMHLLLTIFPEREPVGKEDFQRRVERRQAWLTKTPKSVSCSKLSSRSSG